MRLATLGPEGAPELGPTHLQVYSNIPLDMTCTVFALKVRNRHEACLVVTPTIFSRRFLASVPRRLLSKLQ